MMSSITFTPHQISPGLSVAGSWKHGNETSGSIQDREFLE